MKGIQLGRVATFGMALVCGVAFGGPFPNQVKWNTSVTEGYIDDVANWKDRTTLPGEGETQTFDLSGVKNNVTVRVGPGTNVTQQAHFYVVNRPNTITFTFDTTGGRYLQAAAKYYSNWQGAGFFTSSTTHFCNFENVNTAGGAPLFALEDGQLVSEYVDNRQTVRLAKGTWNCYDPIPGGTLAQNTLMVGGGVEASQTLLAGGHFKGAKIVVRGGRLRVTGGEHEAWDTVTLGSAYARNVFFEIAGGSFAATNSINVGGDKAVTSSTLDVSGTGHLKSTSVIYVGMYGSATNLNALALFRDQATADLKDVTVGQGAYAVNARFVTTNAAQVVLSGTLRLGGENAATGTVEVTDHSVLQTYAANLAVDGSDRGATMRVTDEATWRPQGDVVVGGNSSSSSTATLALDGHGLLQTDGGFSMYVRQGGLFTVAAGARVAASNMLLRTTGASNARIELNGTCDIRQINVDGAASVNDPALTNIVRISGGTHRGIMGNNSNYVGLTVGSDGATTLFEMTGGSFVSPRISRVGYGAAGTGIAVIRMLGGLLQVSFGDGCGNLNVADSVASKGRLELLGGTVKAQAIRGWTGSTAKGGSGSATALADGGTVASEAPVSSTPFFETFDSVTLGARGLTIDTAEIEATVNQAFTDLAADVTGRVIKVGYNALTVQANSAHGETDVAGGTLAFASGVTQFGRTLVVTNGATVSLAGEATALTVERLVLGDATTRGFLALDADDVVTITGADGLSVGLGYVIGSVAGTTLGVQTILRLAPGASVSAAEIAKLRMLGGSSDYDYTFELADDGTGNQVIQLRTAERQTTAGTWTGAASTAWATPENWADDAVPGDHTAVTFPADAARRSVTVADDTEVHGLTFAAAYDLAGAGTVALRALSAEAGTTTVAVALAPTESMKTAVTADAALTLSGPVISTGDFMSFDKSGTGLLTLAGASPLWTGDWIFSGGLTRATGAQALGPEQVTGEAPALTVGPATLAFAGSAQAYERATTLAAGTGTGAVLRAEGDVTLRGTVIATSGGLVKTGAGTLTLDGMDSKVNVLAVDHMGGKANTDPDSVAPVLPADGSGPASAGLGGLSILEGTMRLTGNGAARTLFTQAQYLLIGARYAVAANPVLEVSRCTLAEGCAGEHLLVGGTTPPDTAALAPTLRILDDGIVNADTVRVGDRGHVTGCALPVTPTLAVTNGALNASYLLRLGSDSDAYVTSRARLGAGSTVTAAGAGGVVFKHCCDIEIADGGLLSAVSAKGPGVCFHNEASGSLRLLRNGRITALKLSSTSYHIPGRAFTLTFDGGILELTGDGLTSVVCGPDDYTVDMTGAGGTIVVAGTKSHRLALPIVGTGPLVKAGTGELVFGPGQQIVSGGAIAAADFVPLQLSGRVKVAEGTLALEAGGAADTVAISVASGARVTLGGDMTLGGLSGAGVFCGTNETALALSCALDVSDIAVTGVPTFEKVALGTVRVDFAGTAYAPGARLTVATLGTGVSADLTRWRARNVGSGLAADLAREGDAIVATVRTAGFVLLFR